MNSCKLLLCLFFQFVVFLPALAANSDVSQAYEQRIQSLEQRIEELENQIKGVGEDKSEVTELAPEEISPQPIQPTGNEKLLPDISIIVDTLGITSTTNLEPNRDQIQIRGIELGIQGYLYPQIRGDVFITAEGEELSVGVEEAYASFLQIGNTDLSLNIGKKFINFGKNNPVHREKWPFVTQPFAIRNLLNPEEGLTGQGAQVNYLLPLKGNLFCQAEVGIWKPSVHHHEHAEGVEHHELGIRVHNRLYTGRLWLSKPVRDFAELEVGMSIAGGKGEESLGNPNTRLYGIDLTYRAWPAAHKQILLQAEVVRQKRWLPEGDGARNGYYLLYSYKLNKYNEAGIRYDWASLPAPEIGHDSGLSAIYTRRLTETSYMRLQVTRGSSSNSDDYISTFLQFVWGLGPHSHDLQ